MGQEKKIRHRFVMYTREREKKRVTFYCLSEDVKI